MGGTFLSLPAREAVEQALDMFKKTRPTPLLHSLRAALVLAFGLFGGTTTANATVAGEPLQVLVFWGSWCGNCPPVMRQMEALRKEYEGRNVEFVAVSLEGEDAPQNYLRRKGYGFQLKTDGDALMARYEAVGVPWVVLIDTAGKVVSNPSRHGSAAEVGARVKMELDLRT